MSMALRRGLLQASGRACRDEDRLSHNPEVAGSNPAPATKVQVRGPEVICRAFAMCSVNGFVNGSMAGRLGRLIAVAVLVVLVFGRAGAASCRRSALRAAAALAGPPEIGRASCRERV